MERSRCCPFGLRWCATLPARALLHRRRCQCCRWMLEPDRTSPRHATSATSEKACPTGIPQITLASRRDTSLHPSEDCHSDVTGRSVEVPGVRGLVGGAKRRPRSASEARPRKGRRGSGTCFPTSHPGPCCRAIVARSRESGSTVARSFANSLGGWPVGSFWLPGI